jgi:diguanylate cyclase
MKSSKELCLLFIAVIVFLLLFTFPVLADQREYANRFKKENFYSLQEGWEYRWGDLPKNEKGEFLWHLGEDEKSGEWSFIGFPSNPPSREGRTIVWYRVRLPQRRFRDPTLFITSIDLNAEFYLDGKRIYRFGKIDNHGEGAFLGWPIHLIELPKDYEGKYLYVRAYSDYRDIGLWGDIYLGQGKDILTRIFQKEIMGLTVLIVSVLIGIVFIVLYIINKKQRTLLYLALLSFALALRVFGNLSFHHITGENSMFWEFLDIVTILVIPVFITLILHTIVTKRYKRITRIVWKAYAIFGLVIVFLLGIDIFPLTTAYVLTDLSSFIGVLVLGYISFQNGRGGTVEQKLISINFLIMAAIVVYSFFMSYGLLPWLYEFDYIMVFLFSLGMTVILGRRLYLLMETLKKQSHRLSNVNKELERLVIKRTEEIECAKKELEAANNALREERNTLKITSITDGLTGLYNRTYIEESCQQEIREAVRYGRDFSLALFDIDHFKRVNDEFGHQTGDRVLKKISFLFKEVLRETDIAGRYGGEEFLVLFPATEEKDAIAVCERLRKKVESMIWTEGPEKITISGGLASYPKGSGLTEEKIIKIADKNLYMAKESGRNMVWVSAMMHQK